MKVPLLLLLRRAVRLQLQLHLYWSAFRIFHQPRRTRAPRDLMDVARDQLAHLAVPLSLRPPRRFYRNLLQRSRSATQPRLDRRLQPPADLHRARRRLLLGMHLFSGGCERKSFALDWNQPRGELRALRRVARRRVAISRRGRLFPARFGRHREHAIAFCEQQQHSARGAEIGDQLSHFLAVPKLELHDSISPKRDPRDGQSHQLVRGKGWVEVNRACATEMRASWGCAQATSSALRPGCRSSR